MTSMRLVVLLSLVACSRPADITVDAAQTDATATVDDAAVDAAVDAAPDAPPDAPPVPIDDPFDPASCGGAAWTQADALAKLGAASRVVLANATIQVRSRSCTGTSCDPWGVATSWQTRFLTYSGGVTTRYMNLQADTRIVLHRDGAAAKLSVQHVTFTQGGYPDSDGMVFYVPAAPVTYPVFRAYNVTPQFQSDYRDLELTLKNGVLAVGQNCARFTANVFGASEPFTTEYAALYRWP